MLPIQQAADLDQQSAETVVAAAYERLSLRRLQRAEDAPMSVTKETQIMSSK